MNWVVLAAASIVIGIFAVLAMGAFTDLGELDDDDEERSE